jgi:hypothetical protein
MYYNTAEGLALKPQSEAMPHAYRRGMRAGHTVGVVAPIVDVVARLLMRGYWGRRLTG